jgi:hypothetical protein
MTFWYISPFFSLMSWMGLGPAGCVLRKETSLGPQNREQLYWPSLCWLPAPVNSQSGSPCRFLCTKSLWAFPKTCYMLVAPRWHLNCSSGKGPASETKAKS